MNAHTTKLFWIFLIIPTFTLGIITLIFLDREVDRMWEQAKAFEETVTRQMDARARNIGVNLLLALREVKETLQESLEEISVDADMESLREFEERHPLVKKIYLWHGDAGYLYPLGETLLKELGNPPWTDGEASPTSGLVDGGEIYSPRSQTEMYNQLQARQNLKNLARNIPYGIQIQTEPLEPPPRRPRGTDSPATETISIDQESLPEETPPIEEESATLSKRGDLEGFLPMASTGSGTSSTGWKWIQTPTRNRAIGEISQPQLIGWQSRPYGTFVVALEVHQETLIENLRSLLPSGEESGEKFELLRYTAENLLQSFENPSDRRWVEGFVPLAPELPSMMIRFQANLQRDPWNPTILFWIGFAVVIGITGSVSVGGLILLRQVQEADRDARRKADFVANVSHELKTPLTSIQLYTEMLDSDRIVDETRRHHYLGTIQKESERLARLVGNLLNQNRLERGEFKLKPGEHPLKPLLDDALARIRAPLENAKLALHEEIPINLPPVWTDPDAFQQILGNLIDNAIKYARGGGEISIEANQSNRGIRIMVKDRGKGVPYNFRKRLFEQFERSDEALSAREAGMGLGLSIARGQARAMGGDLIYTPRSGGGSIFTLILKPVQKAI